MNKEKTHKRAENYIEVLSISRSICTYFFLLYVPRKRNHTTLTNLQLVLRSLALKKKTFFMYTGKSDDELKHGV